MKLETTTPYLEQSANFPTTEFRIDDSPHAFELLIKKLYSNPIESLVRELVSNAWDSHIQANTTHLPVEILLPTTLEQSFTVKDSGTGLSPDQIRDLYTVLFRSNRQQSNDYLGGFGLGSKSPFAYSDQFNVTSNWNGHKHHYACYIGPNGKPQLSLMEEALTDEHNGLTIKIPVRNGDEYKFTNAVQNLKDFPNLRTNTIIEPPAILWETPYCKVEKLKPAEYGGGVYARIGCVRYEINTYHLFKDLTNRDSIIKPGRNIQGRIIIPFDIGELAITPNREELIYNEKTVKTIETKWLDIRKRLTTDIQKGIQDCPTYVNACKGFAGLRSIFSNLGWWNDQTMVHPERPGESISRYLEIPIDDLTIGVVDSSNRRNAKLKLDYWCKREIKLDITKNIHLFYLPADTRRVSEYLKQANNYMSSDTSYYIVLADDINSLVKQLEDIVIGKVTIKDLSGLCIPKRETWRRQETVKTIDDNTLYTYSVNDRSAYILTDEGHEITTNWCDWQLKMTLDVFNALSTNYIDHLITLPKSKWRLGKKHAWRNFIEEANDLIPDTIRANLDRLERYTALSSSGYGNRIKEFIEQNLAVDIDSPLITFIKKYHYDPITEKIVQIAKNYGIDIPENKAAKKEIKEIYEKYAPFFNYTIYLHTNPELLIAYDQYLENQNNA